MKKIALYLLLIISLSAAAPLAWGQSLAITLTWSADTYVPADYPGQALPSRGSIVEVAANLDSNKIDFQKLTYNWYLNGDFQKDSSGKGKQTFRFDVGEVIDKTHFVEVKISDSEGKNTGQSQRLPIKVVEPQIVVSLLRPRLELLRLSDLLAGKFQISAGQETKFIAQPYFFNIKQPDELDYDWKFGEEEISQSGTKNPNVFNLKIGEVLSPIIRFLNLFVENKTNQIQRARTEAEIVLSP